ncbi:MAG TPA: hypothetical protein VFV50_12045 [Bdellovibrionales bacterium]|nr:hypothetical protein [Bdellovibrionales bacterium]
MFNIKSVLVAIMIVGAAAAVWAVKDSLTIKQTSAVAVEAGTAAIAEDPNLTTAQSPADSVPAAAQTEAGLPSSMGLSGQMPKAASLRAITKAAKAQGASPAPVISRAPNAANMRLAQNSAATVSEIATTTTDVIEAPASKTLGLSLSVVGKSSLHSSPNDPSKQTATELWVGPSVKLSEKLKLAGLAVYTRDFENREEPNTITNTKISLSYAAIPLSRILSLAPLVAVRLPTNREAREDDRLQGGLAAEASLALETGRASGLYRLAISRNIHEQVLDRNGSPNIEWNYSNLLKGSYKLTNRVSATLGGEYIISRTYRNFQRQKFDLSEEINIDAGQGFSIDIGHSNSGDALRPNLRDSNIKLFDDEDSVIYLGLNYVY